ncbi:sigma-70 family RNA polymerase sigma factor [Candidatus Thiothrix sp. Deng01]|uniref:Sigma-70 family RNA polymerase sigma factor n=1 Tax=Candidatus Thiothrix phosphatis TaxID=3112415 RepID=A0ABU6D110_9GAMM|nr:sigma-70 family RNA polymerase sigma factor [Candidatus Thiothrix sp. Deng01]MEB4592023.1 sigma-70 family RNA polymerase sigma factor [Candidatus Thiothrix sp. Deng01]
MHTLNQLLAASAQGDAQAFQHLYQQASPRLFALCLKMLYNDHATAEDVLQEAFVKIWHNAASFDAEKASAMTWMGSILRNQVLDQLRYASKRPVTEELDFETMDYADTGMQPEALHALGEQTDMLAAALTKLPENHRECILQSCYYGYSHSEIAERQSVPLGTVKAWVRRGIERLQRDCMPGLPA